MTTAYRIYTEDRNRDEVLAVLAMRFEGFTVSPAIGAWRGRVEQSLVVELFGVDRVQVEKAAREIAVLNQQEAVAIMEFQTEVKFVQPTAQEQHLMYAA
jgi:hypothetical protein